MNKNDDRLENTQNEEDKKNQDQEYTVVDTDKVIEISKEGSRKYRHTLDKLSNT